ncbi:MAG: replicative DNA helicase [Halobacillus sp.]|uniref:replicative DNA helicase n=1 Tax=Halobacillus sp. TaxID=56800 RepID=UPI003BAE8B38
MIYNREAEQSVIGTILYEGTLMKDATLMADHFADPRHQLIFRAMQKVYKKEAPVNLVSVTTELNDKITAVGGVSYLADLAGSVPTTQAFKHDQRLVLEAFRNRKGKEQALRYIENPSHESLEELLNSLEAYRGMTAREAPSTYDTLMEIAREMVQPRESNMSGYSTGYPDLDQMTGGSQKGDLMILAGRPSMGKTAFALNLAAHHCKAGGEVHLFSLEMGHKELLKRMISCEAEVDGQKWRSMKFSNEDYERAMTAIGVMAEWNMVIHERENTVADIRAAIRQAVHKNEEGRPLVVIDYLQLMASTTRFERRDLEVGAMTRELKLLARELEVPILLLSQLSRGVEQRQDKRPVMSDLRESGSIEQDADVIGFLYREDYYNWKAEDQDRVEFLLSKQRNGPVGMVGLKFMKAYGKFTGV